MRLKDGKDGETFLVLDMSLPPGTQRRLEVLGLIEGSSIQVMNNKKKGAMIVKIRGTRFALGRKITENITVDNLPV